ncbi:RING-H2 finger protein ATL79-like [Panicum miliaceum]|uniref:RING-H2 finger protein ATL79-like n=1 Tax=Panicum miliaceum TaxID=4540 RepID=A0A3L6QJ23_PANMI|nr:RING-H2 finger protein ATL79-like [Panicum miliaceum]
MAMAPQGQEHEQPHGQRPAAPTNHPAAPGSTIATNRWGPYSGAGDFASNMAVILAALLAALALALALNAAVRYVLRRARRAAGGATEADPDPDPDPEKAAVEAPPPPPALVYSAAGTKLAGAAAECAICLAEFVDGDAVRVMPACGHGFHARCIERWLAGGRRSSCPTCRAPLHAAAAGGAAAAASPSS